MASVINPLLGTSTSTGGTGSNLATSLGSVINSIPAAGAVTSALSGAAGSVGTTLANGLEATFFSSRVIAIVLGLILITGAILLYIGEDLAGAIESGKSGVAKVGSVVAG